MIWSKVIPWAGYPLALALFWFWLEGRENLAAQVEICNNQKLQAVADAERTVREALAAATERERVAAMERVRRAQAAAESATAARLEAEEQASRAQATIRRLMREVNENENVTVEQACLAVDVPADIVSSLR